MCGRQVSRSQVLCKPNLLIGAECVFFINGVFPMPPRMTRMTLRRWMVLIGVVSILLWIYLWCTEPRSIVPQVARSEVCSEKQAQYRSRASFFERKYFLTMIELLKAATPGEGGVIAQTVSLESMLIPVELEPLRRRARYYRQLMLKYKAAADSPCRPLMPDPPDPSIREHGVNRGQRRRKGEEKGTRRRKGDGTAL